MRSDVEFQKMNCNNFLIFSLWKAFRKRLGTRLKNVILSAKKKFLGGKFEQSCSIKTYCLTLLE
jgi:hypothetical protein